MFRRRIGSTPLAVAIIFLLSLAGTGSPLAAPSLATEYGDSDDTYHIVLHYEVVIDASPMTIWPHLINPGSWMVEFEMSHVAGPSGQVGEVLRLYSGQEFYSQVTGMIPGKLYSAVNLPSVFRDEASTGIVIITLSESQDGTLLSLTMSRRYTWLGTGLNPSREVRASTEFLEASRITWEDKFLAQLKNLAESSPQPTTLINR